MRLFFCNIFYFVHFLGDSFAFVMDSFSQDLIPFGSISFVGESKENTASKILNARFISSQFITKKSQETRIFKFSLFDSAKQHLFNGQSEKQIVDVPNYMVIIVFGQAKFPPILIQFPNSDACQHFATSLDLKAQSLSSFDDRTDQTSAVQYFQFYSCLSQQQNMMSDYIRTTAYQKAIYSNLSDFRGKVVLDVGAGNGILSFFAAHAGAKKVYAVEASSMAAKCQTLVTANNLGDRICVINSKMEETILPEQVDVIVSEPIGYMLLNERMIETFLFAKKWLKPGGKMYPSESLLFVTPFSDESLFLEVSQKTQFWSQTHFYGVNLSSLQKASHEECFAQPIVDTFDPRICFAKPVQFPVNFKTCLPTDLENLQIPCEFDAQNTGFIHGLAFWFDLAFGGTDTTIWLSTSPREPLTHWYQVRILFTSPLFVTVGTKMRGHVSMIANERQSYDVTATLKANESVVSSVRVDLKQPYFRYTQMAATASATQATNGGTTSVSPTEAHYATNAAVNNLSVQQPVNFVYPQISNPGGTTTTSNGSQYFQTNNHNWVGTTNSNCQQVGYQKYERNNPTAFKAE